MNPQKMHLIINLLDCFFFSKKKKGKERNLTWTITVSCWVLMFFSNCWKHGLACCRSHYFLLVNQIWLIIRIGKSSSTRDIYKSIACTCWISDTTNSWNIPLKSISTDRWNKVLKIKFLSLSVDCSQSSTRGLAAYKF